MPFLRKSARLRHQRPSDPISGDRRAVASRKERADDAGGRGSDFYARGMVALQSRRTARVAYESSRPTRDLSSCPFCSNHRVCATNSLLANHPYLAAEWHPVSNGVLAPDHVTPGSARRVWWQCRNCNHAWRASVANRVLRASGCPGCAGRASQAAYPEIRE